MPYKDPEKQREADRRWRAANPEKAREAKRKWRQPNLREARAREAVARLIDEHGDTKVTDPAFGPIRLLEARHQ